MFNPMSRIVCAVVVAVACVTVVAISSGCSDENEANRRGIGSACDSGNLCSEKGQVCLTEFAGGYCGVSGCHHDSDCPEGSACVTDDNQVNYCFLTCIEKPDCNLHRSVENEANCTSSLTFVDGAKNLKVCRPPNSGV
jgi:hypothetical protein